MKLVGICGKAGAGKDTLADFLVQNHGFVKVSFADPLKRICREVYEFSDHQLWGPSAMRNAQDARYPRPGLDPGYLTPRLALQILGTEFGRYCYDNTWRDYALRIAKRLLTEQEVAYTKERGLEQLFDINDRPYGEVQGVVIPDVRFRNEVDGINNAQGLCVRISRPVEGLAGAAAQHVSETEQDGIPAELFTSFYQNAGTLEDLAAYARHVAGLVEEF
jgi:hypothetical protein